MPSLRFAPYREIASEIAARLVASREGQDPLAPWDEEVIVPSRGMAEAITAELLARLPRGVAGLQLQSLDELARRILIANGQTPRVASEAERRLAMRIATRTIPDEMLSSRGIASMLERSYRDVRDSGVTLAEFAKRAKNARGLRNAKRTQLVIRTWTEYERVIAQLGAIDPSELFTRAAQLVSERVKPQLLAGFYDMTGVQRQLTEALRVSEIWVPSVLPFAQPFIASFGAAAPLSIQSGGGATALLQYNTRLDEIRDVCARVAQLLANGTPASDIGIVARSFEPYDVHLLNRLAEEHGFATTLREEIPLAAHRIGRGALTLLRLRERGFPRSEVLGLLRDGLHARTVLDVDAVDAAARRARIAGGTSDELRRMRNRSPLIDTYIELVAELEALTTGLDLTRMASLFRIETELDLEAAEMLDGIAALFDRVKGWHGTDVMDAIESSRLESAASRGLRVWTGEILRFRGRSFSHLFVLRMQDDVFPQRRNEDPLLPNSDRRILGLREIGDGRDEEQLLFSLLADAQVYFSYATGDGFGKVLRPSRYVRGVASGALQVPPTCSQRATRNSQRQLQLLSKAGTRSVFDGFIDPVALRKPLSPTQLEDFGECPQKFLLKHILGVQDVDHPERELQIHHRDKGTLDHRVLERFYSSLQPDQFRAPLPADLTQRLDTFIDAQFDEHERVVPPFNRTVRDIERRATKRILREFVNRDLTDLEELGLTPKWFEYRFGGKYAERANHPEPFVVHASGLPVRVEGTIDRIDAGNDRFRIVDYKSGKALRHVNLGEKIDRGVRLQLALYAMAVSEFFDADPSRVSGTIKPLVSGEAKPASFAFTLDEKRATLLETLEIFIRAITTGHFPAFPNANDAEFNSCKYCPVNHSCRTKHDSDERYAVQQQKDPRTLLGGGAS